MPVKGADRESYKKIEFWAYPWGSSITHKGIDIFAREGTDIGSATNGIVLYTGKRSLRGNVVIVLGPKWRIHIYTHLHTIKARMFSVVFCGDVIGTVGNTGNAEGQEPHLHYSIVTIFPYFWLADKAPEGWLKMFFLNPAVYLDELFDE